MIDILLLETYFTEFPAGETGNTTPTGLESKLIQVSLWSSKGKHRHHSITLFLSLHFLTYPLPLLPVFLPLPLPTETFLLLFHSARSFPSIPLVDKGASKIYKILVFFGPWMSTSVKENKTPNKLWRHDSLNKQLYLNLKITQALPPCGSPRCYQVNWRLF